MCDKNLLFMSVKLSWMVWKINLKAALAICGVFLGCFLSVVFLELIVKWAKIKIVYFLIWIQKSLIFSRNDPGAGNLVTFLQFFFIASVGLVFNSKFFTVRPVIAMRDYVTLVLMFFVSNVANNYAFNLHIPMPLNMIFRSGSLMANMVMGIIILKKSYQLLKYISVVLITIGIIVCSVASGTTLKESTKEESDDDFGVLFWWSIGISLFTIALFISARMGIYQETLFKKYGKHPYEALFYTHVLPLPGFLLLSGSIFEHSSIALHSSSFSLTNFTLSLLNVRL